MNKRLPNSASKQNKMRFEQTPPPPIQRDTFKRNVLLISSRKLRLFGKMMTIPYNLVALQLCTFRCWFDFNLLYGIQPNQNQTVEHGLCAAHNNKTSQITTTGNDFGVTMTRSDLKTPPSGPSNASHYSASTRLFMKAWVFCSCGFPHNRGFQPLVLMQPDQYFIKRASLHVGSVTCRTREARCPSIRF